MTGREEPALAIVVPAHNEAEGIGEFLAEIDSALREAGSAVTFVVVDDASTDDTARVVERAAEALTGDLVLVRSAVNAGHGPTLLRGHRRALEMGAGVIVAVDGDGQYDGRDVARVASVLSAGATAVCGVRRERHDPIERRILTRLLRIYVWLAFGVRARDVNCPLRGYRRERLAELLAGVPHDALIPNVHLTVLAAVAGSPAVELLVAHRVRRGSSVTGTMFAGRSRRAALARLGRFSARALGESLGVRSQRRAGRDR